MTAERRKAPILLIVVSDTNYLIELFFTMHYNEAKGPDHGRRFLQDSQGG
jgi:hypothetical protein